MNTAWRIALYGAMVLLATLPRISQLDAFLSPDEFQWERNTQGFKAGLRAGDLAALYQQPHPGITTTWLAALTIDSPDWGTRRLPIAITIVGLIILTTYLCNRLLGEPYGYSIGVLLSIDPLYVAHSRVLAMDALLGGFLILSLVCVLLWQKERHVKWLIWCGAACAAAILSKMSGAVILPIVAAVIVSDFFGRPTLHRVIVKNIGIWLAATLGAAVLLLPTIVTNFSAVWQGTKTFFGTEHFTQAVHALGPQWYPEALLLWSMPVTIGLLFLLPLVWRSNSAVRRTIVVTALFGLVFFLAMQYSIKKGDRYLLPTFLAWDVLAAIAGSWLMVEALRTKKIWLSLFVVISCAGVIWQTFELYRLHPHALAYRNPWFKQLAIGRTMGWGEGLELAAHYLNQKPDAANLLVAAYYEGSFQYRFVGKITSAQRLAKESASEIGADYVVLYRTMQGRAPGRWETKVLRDYADQTPEHIITLNSEEYVWIYRVTR